MVQALLRLGRYSEARKVGPTLSSMLHSAKPSRVTSPPQTERGEKTLANALSGLLISDDVWSDFELAFQERTPDHLAREATRLYTVSQPWAMRSLEHDASAAAKAAAIVRGFADGYAMLSALPPAENADSLPLLNRRSVLEALRGSPDVEVWASKLGHAFTIDALTPGEPLNVERGPAAEIDDVEVIRLSLGPIYDFDVLVLRYGVENDVSVWEDDHVSAQGALYIEQIRGLINRLVWSDGTGERLNFAMVSLVTAQTLFTASHRSLTSDEMLIPCPADLRAFLSRSGALDWVAKRDICLPVWAEASAERGVLPG
jgi:hypothetical protein